MTGLVRDDCIGGRTLSALLPTLFVLVRVGCNIAAAGPASHAHLSYDSIARVAGASGAGSE